jgi:hypothetical protein
MSWSKAPRGEMRNSSAIGAPQISGRQGEHLLSVCTPTCCRFASRPNNDI